MNKSLATFSSGLILAVSLTSPAWAQIGRGGLGASAGSREQGSMGLGHSDLSTSSSDRTGVEARTNQQGMVKGSTKVQDSTNGTFNTKNKIKANANAQAGGSANVKVKKQKHNGKNKPLQVNSDANAKVSSSAGDNVDSSATANTSVH